MAETTVTLSGGRLTLGSQIGLLTSARGIHLALTTANGESLSTEGAAVTTASADGGYSMETKPNWGDYSYHWQVQPADGVVQLTITVRLAAPLLLKKLSLMAPLCEAYDIYFNSSEKHALSERNQGMVWGGFPAKGYLGFESSRREWKPVRVTLADDCPLFEARLWRYRQPTAGVCVELVRFGSESAPLELAEGEYLVFRGDLSHQAELPAPLLYPKELFAEKPVKTVLVVSAVDAAQTMQQIERLQKLLPGFRQDLSWQQPQVIVSWEGSGGSLEPMVPQVPAMKGVRGVIEQARQWRRTYHPELVVRLQPDLHATFGGRFNLMALLMGVTYKAKIDRSGESLFICNAPLLVFRRRWERLAQKHGRLAMKGFKSILLLCLMTVFPFLARREKQRAKDKKP